MSSFHYLQSYQAACRRYAESYQELYGEDRWEEWTEELGKIKASWKWSVARMLTQQEAGDSELWLR